LEDVRRGMDVMDAVRHHPLSNGGYVSKDMLVAVYRQQVAERGEAEDPAFLARIRMKPVRSLSGVTTITVLTAPHPCPGECIFCPDDARMPKSYLPEEPGAARAFENDFDPYAQVSSRLESLIAVGHPTDKIELLILGGTWDAYPPAYQTWFIGRCFDALNIRQDFPPLAPPPSASTDAMMQTLEHVFRFNETASHRNVGLVIETRPDQVHPDGLAWLRQLGVTKVQLGAQSLDDAILALNCRGHTSAETHRAVALLRAAAFKVVLHWMPNLLGATLESDQSDFARLWQGICPDELKIYPTQLLPNAPLFQHWQAGEYQPYSMETLIDLIATVKAGVPSYCRINRVIRDIPSTYVVAGNRRTSLRQDVLAEMERRGECCHCIRCREVRSSQVQPSELSLDDLVYYPDGAEEHFISFVTPADRIAGYLRLSLPDGCYSSQLNAALPELNGAALIREVHIYGQSLGFGSEQSGAAQHIGLGTSLLQQAEQIARQRGFQHLAVIAAVGTRGYYRSRGFHDQGHYLVKDC